MDKICTAEFKKFKRFGQETYTKDSIVYEHIRIQPDDGNYEQSCLHPCVGVQAEI